MDPAVHGRDLDNVANDEDGYAKRQALAPTPPTSGAVTDQTVSNDIHALSIPGLDDVDVLGA